MVNVKNLLKLHWKSHKNINIYYIGHVTVEDSDYVKFNSLNPLYLIVSELDEYIKEKNRSNYLVFESANENNEVLKNIINVMWFKN